MLRSWWLGRILGSWSRRRSRRARCPNGRWFKPHVEFLEQRALLAAFTSGDVVVYRVGNGSDSLVNTGSPVFLDEYTPAGSLVQSISLPTSASGANHRLIASGTATSEGELTRSADGRYLVLTGYDAAMPTTSLSSTTSTAVNRVIGRVDSTGAIDTTTALTDAASGNNPRSAASTDGNTFWIGGGAGGIRAATLGATTSTALNTIALRYVNVFDGQLYLSNTTGSSVRVATVGTGTPTSGSQSVSNLPGFPTTDNPNAFFLANLDGQPGVDTLYVADDTANEIQKYSLSGGNWNAEGSVSASAVRGLTGVVSGTTVSLYATTGGNVATGGGSLYSVTDTSGYGGTMNGSVATIASAANNTAFRGVALAPVPATTNTPPTITAVAPLTGAIGDATNPGVTFTVGDAETPPDQLTVTASGNNQNVVPDANLTLSHSAATWTLNLNPVGVGYATISLTVSDGLLNTSTTLAYAASLGGGPNTRFFNQAGEASTAIAIDSDHMIEGDDNDQALRLYHRNNSGSPISSFDFTSSLGLTDISGGVPRTVDIEASTQVGNRIFWMGSESNSSSGDSRPDKDRIFTTDISGTGDATTLSYVGRYDFLREDLINWDVNNLHGKGANYYGFADSAAAGVSSDGSSGYNIEGLTMASGSSTVAYIGFRAPQTPDSSRTLALLVPVLNFTTLGISGGPQGSAIFGDPIELDLGGRGVREIRANAFGYLISAGPAAGPGTLGFKLYTWDGNPADAPLARGANPTTLHPEAIAEMPSGPLTNATPIQLLSDDGNVVWYGDGVTNSNLTIVNFRKFRSDVVTLGGGVDTAPAANNDSYSSNEDTLFTVSGLGVLANDTDVNGDLLQASVSAGPLHGTLTLNANGAFSYRSSQDFNGTDSFTYKANDGGLDSNTATVTIVVNAVNDRPVANSGSYSVNEDATLSVAAAGVLANDTDVDPGTGQPETLTAILVGTAGHGTLTLQGNGAFTYLGSLNFNGTDHFTYKANDGGLESSTATVTIVVNAVNDAPVANNDSYMINGGAALVVPIPGVLANDTDVDNDPLSVVLAVNPAHGTLTLKANGAFSYFGNSNFHGLDSFTYSVSDGSLTATGSVSILVDSAPVANNNVFSVFEDLTLAMSVPGVLDRASDADGDTLTALLATGPFHGALTLNTNGSFIYTPSADYNGTDSFSYQANDGFLNSNTGTVAIIVVPVNDRPVTNNDSYITNENTPLTVPGSGVLANDTDIDSTVLTARLTIGPSHGTLTLNADGSFNYTPALNYSGADSFTYQANDGLINSSAATVTFSIAAADAPPQARNDTYSTFADSPRTVNAPGVLNNDSDTDSSVLTAQLVAGPAHGTLSLSANGKLIYTPGLHFSGTDSFTYQVNDGTLNSNTATVTLAVLFVNHAPQANADAYTVSESTPLAITASAGVLANDTDVDGQTLTAKLVIGPSHGTLTFNGDGSFSYTPFPGFFGTDTFQYRASDGSQNSNRTTVTLAVTDVSSLVSAVSSALTDNHDGTFSGTITITNITSSTDIDGPLQVVLTNLTSGVTLHNKTGDTPAGNPYITIPASSLPGGKLAHGQSVEITVIFDDPLALSINYAVKTLSGTI